MHAQHLVLARMPGFHAGEGRPASRGNITSMLPGDRRKIAAIREKIEIGTRGSA
jgi:hypothetical protein